MLICDKLIKSEKQELLFLSVINFAVQLWLYLQEDGGSPISHYVVEKKGKSGRWTPVSKFCRGNSCDITDLEEGESYEFRVSADNDQGQSEPLVTDRPIIAKHPFG